MRGRPASGVVAGGIARVANPSAPVAAALALGLGACSFRPGATANGVADGQPSGDGTAAHDGRASDGRITDGQPADAGVPDVNLALACPASYGLHDSARPMSHYRNVTASVTWATAEADCEDDATAGATQPAHLIVIDDLAELQWAWDQNNSQQWFGVTDSKIEQVYAPVTDQLPPFFVGSASGNLPSKDCLILGMFSSQLDSQSEGCTSSHPYICECDGRAADHTHF